MGINFKKIALIGFVVILCLLLLWSWLSVGENKNQELVINPAENQNFVSAIQPIDDKSLTNRESSTNRKPLTGGSTSQDQNDFNQALMAVKNGDKLSARQTLISLIERNPGLLEPYINLASIKTQEGDLDGAHATLLQGLNANPNYKQLFDALQKVHSALAANAYKLALAASDAERSAVGKQSIKLPLVFALSESVSPQERQDIILAREEIVRLKDQLGIEKNSTKVANVELAQAKTQITSLSQQISQSNNKYLLAKAAANSAKEGNAATDQLLRNSQAKLTELESKLGFQESELAEKHSQLQQQKSELAQLKTQLASLNVQLESSTLLTAKLQQQIDSNLQAVASTQTATTAVLQNTTALTSSDRRNELTASKVHSWAQAWSNQDVDLYVSHYINGYRPLNSELSNKQWRSQRQVRLTNKRFIQVDISELDLVQNGNQVIATFVQRYRANAMDDTVRKQLIFEAVDGDWQNAKIIKEQVIRG